MAVLPVAWHSLAYSQSFILSQHGNVINRFPDSRPESSLRWAPAFPLCLHQETPSEAQVLGQVALSCRP